MAENRIPVFLHCIAVLWPSFLVAVIASGLFFSAFDPDNLYPFGERVEISRLGFYTLGFLFFWTISILSAIGALYFTIVNRTRRAPPTRDR